MNKPRRLDGMSLEQKLNIRLDKNGPNGCWVWTAGGLKQGYGRINHGRKLLLSHRAAWTVWRGPIPSGLFVLHKCDNPPCCNPEHLFLGDHAANDADKRRKGRQPSMAGTRNPNVRRTPDEVRAIRADTRPVPVIASELGCNPSYVHYIKKRKLWASLP